jgi:ketosteroid isomerase-like protein
MSKAEGRTANEAQIVELLQAWARSMRARDLDGILAHHAHDMVMFDVPPPVKLQGIREYRNSWQPFLEWLGDSGLFEVGDVSVIAGEDVAWCHALVRCVGSSADGELLVRLTVCYRKIDAQWTVIHEHHSVPAA